MHEMIETRKFNFRHVTETCTPEDSFLVEMRKKPSNLFFMCRNETHGVLMEIIDINNVGTKLKILDTICC